jgi:hypothetical protein
MTARVTLIAIISKLHKLNCRIVSYFFSSVTSCCRRIKCLIMIYPRLAEENNFVELWFEAMVPLYVLPGNTFCVIVDDD